MKSNSLLAIKKLPSIYETYLWADCIELFCLVSPDGRISKADILDRLQEELSIDKSLLDPPDDKTSLDHDNKDEIVEDFDVNEKIDDRGNKDNRDNKWEQKIDDWFGHLKFRAGEFGKTDTYPFEIASDTNTIIRKANITLKHKLYIFFLIASSLRYTPDLTIRNKISSDFEAVCEAALKKCLPHHAEVYIFGTGTQLQGSKELSGNLFTKISKLSDLLHETVRVKEEHLSKYNVGDGGLDIVGWVPMGDSSPGLLCIFGQCACNLNEWLNKQHSASFSLWRHRLTFQVFPSNATFIPFCFRDSKGDWLKPQDIDSILFDRVRLIYLLQDTHDIVQKLPVYGHLETVIAFRMSLV